MGLHAYMMDLFSIIQRLPIVYWRKVFERLGPLTGFLNRVSLVVTGSLSCEMSISAFLFAKVVVRLARKGGLLTTALYLKQCSVLLQMFYGGVRTDVDHTVWVSTNRSGIPTIIPPHHRRLIMRRDEKSDILVKFYLSWFSLSKLFRRDRPFSRKNVASIEDMSKNRAGTQSMCMEWLNIHHARLLDRYLPQIRNIPINLGMRWIPTWKSVPNLVKWQGKSSLFLSLKQEVDTFYYFNAINIIQGWAYPSALLSPKLVLFARDCEGSDALIGLAYRSVPNYVDELRRNVRLIQPKVQGRVASVCEGGGKRRLFIIGNYVKQRLLRPFHDWAMRVLRSLPQDGTYDQAAPIRALTGKSDLYSFD